MKGSVHFRKNTGWWFVNWYDKKHRKSVQISWYKGERMYNEKVAEKCLSVMQSAVENKTFKLEQFTGKGTDVIPFLYQWLETKKKKSPATYKDYRNSIKNHLEPFFRQSPVQLHEIQLETLDQLLDSIKRGGKGKLNVMMCLRAALDYAWRNKRIPEIPPFPKREDYGIVEPTIKWLPEDRQMKVIDTIPEEHQPVFLFLKYHYRRPGEAMALHKEDYDIFNGVFTIKRSVSARFVVDHTKTHQEHVIPCHKDFRGIADRLARQPGKYFFTCKSSRTEGKRYTDSIMNKIWNKASKKCGEDISKYPGTKHSSCSQFVNEKGGSLSELQMVTDHARYDSVKKYAKTQVSRKRELMERGTIAELLQVKKEKENEKQ